MQQFYQYSQYVQDNLLRKLHPAYSNLYFYKLVQETNPVFASSVTFLIPIVACLWAVWDGEMLNIYHLIAIICIIASLILFFDPLALGYILLSGLPLIFIPLK